MLSARQIAESSSRKKSSSSKPKVEKPEKSSSSVRPKDETPEEKEARREERRIKKKERDARKVAEAEALLGIPRMNKQKNEKDKGKEKEILDQPSASKEPKQEKKPKVAVDEVIGGLQTRKPTVTIKRTGSSPKREVRAKHLTQSSHSRDISLNNGKDSSTTSRKNGSEHRHHHHHEHSSPEAALSCGRCLRRQRRREEREAVEEGRAELAARLERPERAEAAERDLRRRVEQEERLERSRVERLQEVERPRTERRSRSRAVASRELAPDSAVPVRQVEIIRAHQAERAAAPPQLQPQSTPASVVQQVKVMPARLPERAAVRQVEIIPARQVERTPLRSAERSTTRYMERILPRPRERSLLRSAEISLVRPTERPQLRSAETPLVRPTERPHLRPADRPQARQVERSQPLQPERASVKQAERPVVERRTRAQSVYTERTLLGRRESSRGPAERPAMVRRESSRGSSTLVERALAAAAATTVATAERPRPILGFELEQKPEKLIECVTCLDDEIPAKEAAKLTCGHWFCNECLKRLFTLSLTDPAHMPPKCCASDHIPLKHVDKLLSYQSKKLWNKKYLEYTTANRIYCPTTDCGEWIQPKDIKNNVGQCQKCKNKVCAMCNGRAHGDGDCPQDPDMLKFFETAEKHKYQKCYSCRAMVELERGCNHMTCHCTAQFCYVCGSKWKSCDCPWFNYEPGEAEREYVVPDWNAREPVPPQVADRPERGHRDQLREDEEAARRLAREMNPGGAAAPNAELGREYYELPPALQIDPLAALGTLGLGLRNGIRRFAADYAEANRVERPTGAAPEPRIERRRTEPIPQATRNEGHEQVRQQVRGRLLNTGPGLGLGLARANGGGAAAFYGAARPAAPAQQAAAAPAATRVNAQAAAAPTPHRQPVHVPTLQRELPRSNFLTASQQAHVERYLAELDLDDAEPAVETPFQQTTTEGDNGEVDPPIVVVPHSQLRRTQTERVAATSSSKATASEIRRPQRGSTSGSGVVKRESDVAGKAGMSLAGIGLRALDITGVQQLVGGGSGNSRKRR